MSVFARSWRFIAALLLLSTIAGSFLSPRTSATAQPRTATDIIADVGITPIDRVGTWGETAVNDYDHDGDNDILVSRHNRAAWQLYKFDSDNRRYVHVWDMPLADHHDCIWGDVNRDNRSDIFCNTGADKGTGSGANTLWIQQPDETFVDEATARGVADKYGRGREAAFFDVNNDGHLDLFVGNRSDRTDVRPSVNRLFINSGTGTFQDRAVEFGIARYDGADCAIVTDVNNDGLSDLYVCNAIFYGTGKGARLYLNEGGLRFKDVTAAAGLGTFKPVKARFADFDNDGDADIAIAEQYRVVIRLNSAGVFGTTQIEFPQGASVRDIASGDVDADGDLDLYIVTVGDDELWLNESGNWTHLPTPQAATESSESASMITNWDGRGRAAIYVGNGFETMTGRRQFITVETGSAPTLTISNAHVVDENATLDIPITAFDVDGDALTLDASALPSFASVTISGENMWSIHLAPDADDQGTYANLPVIVTDGSSFTRSQITVEVNNTANLGPDIAPIGNITIATGLTHAVMIGALDPDNDSLTMSFTGLPAYAAPQSTTDGTTALTMRPGPVDGGTTADITVATSDGQISTERTFSVTVIENQSPAIRPISDISLAEGSIVDIGIVASDPDGHELTLSGVSLPPFVTLVDAGDGTGTLRLTPGFSDAANYSDITIRASDGDRTATTAFRVSVTDAPPTVSANAGVDQVVRDSNADRFADISLDASASLDPAGIVSAWQWSVQHAVIGTGQRPVVSLAVGSARILLTAITRDGVEHYDFVDVTVLPSDRTPPAILAEINPVAHSSGWHLSKPTVTVRAEDETGGTGVSAIICSASGMHQMSPSPWEGETAILAVTKEGDTVVTCHAEDRAGNASEPWTVPIRNDRTPPVVSPVRTTLRSGTQQYSTSIPVDLSWGVTNDGVATRSIQLQRRYSSGSFKDVALAHPLAVSATTYLTFDTATTHQLRAVDEAGRYSPWVTSATTTARLIQDTDTQSISYSGWWRSNLMQRYSGAAGATATLTFVGSSVGWVAATGPDRGKAEVFLDGTSMGIIDLYAPVVANRPLVFALNDLDPTTTHTLTVQVLAQTHASSTSRRIDIDAFVVIR